jgi:hypothetical protein
MWTESQKVHETNNFNPCNPSKTDWTTGVQFPEGAMMAIFFFFFCHRIQTGSRAHPASYPMSTGVKLSTHLQPVPRLRVRGAVSALPQYIFMAWCLVKHGDNFTCLLLMIIHLFCATLLLSLSLVVVSDFVCCFVHTWCFSSGCWSLYCGFPPSRSS